MKYTVIYPSGKVMCFYVKSVAELYASINRGTLVDESVLDLSLIPVQSKIRLFTGEDMFEVSDESGNTFVFDSFEEISQFFGECVWAVGAVDAKITVKFANPTND